MAQRRVPENVPHDERQAALAVRKFVQMVGDILNTLIRSGYIAGGGGGGWTVTPAPNPTAEPEVLAARVFNSVGFTWGRTG